MSKMSELSLVLQELKSCGEKLAGISDELAEIFSSPEEKPEPEKKKASAKKKDEAPVAEPVKEYTFTEVRTVLADKSKAGHTAEVKEILAKHGAEKLSEIKPEEYAAVIAEAEVLE
jgi:hypothetical protein